MKKYSLAIIEKGKPFDNFTICEKITSKNLREGDYITGKTKTTNGLPIEVYGRIHEILSCEIIAD